MDRDVKDILLIYAPCYVLCVRKNKKDGAVQRIYLIKTMITLIVIQTLDTIKLLIKIRVS